MNLARIMAEGVDEFGEYESLVFNGKGITNVEVEDMSASIARAFAGLGVKQGDRVAFVLANCPEVTACFNACFGMGAWAMPVVFVLQPEQMGYIFEHSGAEVVVTHSIFLDKIQQARKLAPNIRHIILADQVKIDGTLSLADMIASNPPDFNIVECEPDDVAVLMYTSGTTGRPKGVMLSHDNLLSNAKMAAESEKMGPGDVGLSVLPLNHSYGVITMLAGSMLGVKGVMLAWFNAEQSLQLIEKHKVAHTAMVPTMFEMLLAVQNKEKYDLSSMERWMCAAAPLTEDLANRFLAAFPGEIFEGYGLTEASPAVSVNRENGGHRMGSVGKPLNGVEVSIQDEDGNHLPPGKQGEICVKGSNVMKGYYKQPEETKKIIIDGWLHTGDVGYLDEDGFLFITDRIRDLIIRGGENIFPSDIEEVLHEHPHVAEAAVIGKKDRKYGEVVMAVVVKRPGADFTIEDFNKFCEEKLARYQRPQDVVFADSLPKNALGKVLKKELRQQYS